MVSENKIDNLPRVMMQHHEAMFHHHLFNGRIRRQGCPGILDRLKPKLGPGVFSFFLQNISLGFVQK